ncbi:MAG TPA: class I SAM-dependent methyltransferase [Acidimicrobiales bacterium]
MVNKMCAATPVAEMRDRVTAGLHGTVVEVGFGSGLNLPHLPPSVDRLLAVDPAMTGRRLAAERIEASAVPVDLVGLDGEELPLGDASVDGAISTFTLCTIPDAGRALRELRRVLRPGAQLHFLEHGLSPDPPVAKWQHRLTPLQRRVAGGCHFDRPIERLIADAGFTITKLRNHYMPGPKTFGYLYEGTAVGA